MCPTNIYCIGLATCELLLRLARGIVWVRTRAQSSYKLLVMRQPSPDRLMRQSDKNNEYAFRALTESGSVCCEIDLRLFGLTRSFSWGLSRCNNYLAN